MSTRLSARTLSICLLFLLIEFISSLLAIEKQHIMLLRKGSLATSSGSIRPHNFVAEHVISKNLVHLDLDVMTRVPVTMHVDRAGGLQQPLHLVEARVQPDQVAVQAAFPDIGEGALLVLVAPDHVVDAVGEEGRVDVDQVDAFGGQLAHDVQVVAPDQAVRLQVRSAKADALHDLGGQMHLRIVVAKTGPPGFPPQRRARRRHVPKPRRRPVELLLPRQFHRRIPALVLLPAPRHPHPAHSRAAPHYARYPPTRAGSPSARPAGFPRPARPSGVQGELRRGVSRR